MTADHTSPTEHDFYAPARAPSAGLVWPAGATLAVVFLLSVEYYELRPPTGSFMPPNLPGGFGRGPYPDFRTYSHREYGNRVGVFRLLDLFARYGIRGTAAADSYTAAHRPAIIRRLQTDGWEIAGHGQTVTRVISAQMAPETERRYVAEALASVEKACGQRPIGWHGPEYGESANTPTILAEQRITYVLDWPNDDRPYWMQTPSGRLVSLPVAAELDDVCAHWHRKIPMDRWRQSVVDAVERLAADGRGDGRVLVLNLHPWLMGQAFRASYLEEVLGALARRTDVWITTARELVEYWSARRPQTANTTPSA